MMYLIRTALSRDLGGMDNVDLYRHSYIGTKSLIERYVESTLATIEAVITQSRWDTSVAGRDLLEGMIFARQSFGRSALLLSGGGTFGMAHIGVLKTLFDASLLPRIISGASAGSIVCAVLCTRTDEEIPELISEFAYGDLAVFGEEHNPDGMLSNLRRLLTEGSWSDIKHLTRVMRGLMGDITFQEAYNRTRRILNICVSTESIHELPRLLNYVTAPNVMIWSAVAASCSLPLVFSASPLLVKDPRTGEHHPWNPTPERWIDGSVDNDLPMTRLSEMFNVNHFIVSQVNPHVVPFLSRDDYLSPEGRAEQKAQPPDDHDWVHTLTSLARDEVLHRLQFLTEMGILPNLSTKLRSILSQKYSGDITILPELSLHDLTGLLRNPSVDFMIRSCLAGQRATWPKLSRIKDRCAIELALDRAVHRLRARVVFSESQQDLRKLHTGSYRTPRRSDMRGDASSSTSAVAANQGVRRDRRQSGGSLLTIADRRRLLGVDLNEDGTEAKGLDVEPQQSAAESLAVIRGNPLLKRASQSHTHMVACSSSGPATAPARGPAGFDSSKLKIPSRHHYRQQSAKSDVQRWPDDASHPWAEDKAAAAAAAAMTMPKFSVSVTSPRGDAPDSSEREPSTDRDSAGPASNESELEDDRSRTTPETHPSKSDDDDDDDDEVGAGASVPTDDSEGLWD